LLEKGAFAAIEKCLWVYGRHAFDTLEENLAEQASSKVNYVAVVDNEPKALCKAKSPSVMKKVGGLLPQHGIELKWIVGQPLVPKILSKVSFLSPVGYNVDFKQICVGRIVSRSERDGMALSFLPQLLDRVPSCE
jgi:hypothetical protein